MDRRQKLIEVFEDTQEFYRQNSQLANAVHMAKGATKLYEPDDYPDLIPPAALECEIMESCLREPARIVRCRIRHGRHFR